MLQKVPHMFVVDVVHVAVGCAQINCWGTAVEQNPHWFVEWRWVLNLWLARCLYGRYVRQSQWMVPGEEGLTCAWLPLGQGGQDGMHVGLSAHSLAHDGLPAGQRHPAADHGRPATVQPGHHAVWTWVLPWKPGVGQNIAMHAFAAARYFFPVLSFTFLVHSPSFFPNPLITLSPC